MVGFIPTAKVSTSCPAKFTTRVTGAFGLSLVEIWLSWPAKFVTILKCGFGVLIAFFLFE